MCECGSLDCSELIVFRLCDFDERSRPGTIVAHHEGPYPDPIPIPNRQIRIQTRVSECDRDPEAPTGSTGRYGSPRSAPFAASETGEGTTMTTLNGQPIRVSDVDVCSMRRHANESTAAMALRYGAGKSDVLQFLCECGSPDCDLIVLLEIGEFGPFTPPGSVTARHEERPVA